MDAKKKRSIAKSSHPFDSWPPHKKLSQKLITKKVSLARNVSYRDPDEYLDVVPDPVYDTQTDTEIEQEDKDSEKSAESDQK